METTAVEPDWRSRFLALITDPSIAYILLLLGMYGLLFEFYNPGFVLPGVVGAICLLVALYALQLLPVNYAGVALLVVGIAFMIAEVFVPAYGSLGIGGIVAFVIGSVMMIDTDVPGFVLPWPLIAAIAVPERAVHPARGGHGDAGAQAPGGKRPRGDDRGRRRGHRGFRAGGLGADPWRELESAGPRSRCSAGRRSASGRSTVWCSKSRRNGNYERGVKMGGYFGIALLIGIGLLLFTALRVLREYERGVVFQLGRFWSVKGPGLVIIIPGIQQMVRVDLRTVTMDVPSQDVISRDNVSVKVNAVVYFRVVDPQKAIIQVENFLVATSQLAQTTLRSVLGKHELDEMLAEREKLNLDIQKTLDMQTDAWGIKVGMVEIKHVDVNESMIRAIARQAEAERERRAKVIHAEGEQQASEKLLQAAQTLAKAPEAMQLRYLQTLSNIAGDKSSTIVFPVPMDLITPLLEAMKKKLV